MRLAGEMPVTIVSADSRQIYRGFDIGTAKPTPAERRAVPHAGIDLVDPEHKFSAFAWARAAAQAIESARASGRVPLVVGGAGFYIRALVTPEPDVAAYDARYLVVEPGPTLRSWIEHRVDAMFDAGWADEVRTLDATVAESAPAWQASGYGAIRDLVHGRESPARARERIVIATRQYAKRQRTWFRHQLPTNRVTRIDPREPDAVGTAIRWTTSDLGVGQ